MSLARKRPGSLWSQSGPRSEYLTSAMDPQFFPYRKLNRHDFNTRTLIATAIPKPALASLAISPHSSIKNTFSSFLLKTALEYRLRGKHLKTIQVPPGKLGTFSAPIPFQCAYSMQLRHEPSTCDRRREAYKVTTGSLQGTCSHV